MWRRRLAGVLPVIEPAAALKNPAWIALLSPVILSSHPWRRQAAAPVINAAVIPRRVTAAPPRVGRLVDGKSPAAAKPIAAALLLLILRHLPSWRGDLRPQQLAVTPLPSHPPLRTRLLPLWRLLLPASLGARSVSVISPAWWRWSVLAPALLASVLHRTLLTVNNTAPPGEGLGPNASGALLLKRRGMMKLPLPTAISSL